ncbi:hypothetical protein BGM26_13610 [Bacillus sp. FJAT-29790]|nr:hypothetical protein [Bacillus sp. FJAT-29790]
MLLVVIGTSWL